MSATNRGAERAPLDAYYTPDELARALVRTLDLASGCVVWEPHAGGGAFVRALWDVSAVNWIMVSDINAEAPAIAGFAGPPRSQRRVCDALSGYPWAGRPDWSVGNPPFNEAEEHVRAALSVSKVGVAFLLRMSFRDDLAAAADVGDKTVTRRVGPRAPCAVGDRIAVVVSMARAIAGALLGDERARRAA